MVRLGGEYGSDHAEWHGRSLFLERVEELVPEVLADLRALLPLFEEAYQETSPPATKHPPKSPLGVETVRQRPPEWVQWRFGEGEGDEWDDVRTGDKLWPLKEALQRWGARWNLMDPWLLDVALKTLRGWFTWGEDIPIPVRTLEEAAVALQEELGESTDGGPDDAEDVIRALKQVLGRFRPDEETTFQMVEEWVVETLREVLDDDVTQVAKDVAAPAFGTRNTLEFRAPYFFAAGFSPPFHLDRPGWMPSFRTWSDYETELREHFEKELSQYRESRQKWAERHDLKPAPEKRAGKASYRPGETSKVHFEWLALWQCKGITQKQIADQYARRNRTIQLGIRRTADLIGLTRRSQL